MTFHCTIVQVFAFMYNSCVQANLLLQREFVQLVIDGVEKLIAMEKQLEAGNKIDNLIPDGVVTEAQ